MGAEFRLKPSLPKWSCELPWSNLEPISFHKVVEPTNLVNQLQTGEQGHPQRLESLTIAAFYYLEHPSTATWDLLVTGGQLRFTNRGDGKRSRSRSLKGSTIEYPHCPR